MARSQAQKEADARYAKKRNNKPFAVNLKPEEFEYMDNVIKASGMSKADFLRWAVEELKKKSK